MADAPLGSKYVSNICLNPKNIFHNALTSKLMSLEIAYKPPK